MVAAASYEAREFGIHSAMPSAEALRRCPNLQFAKPRMSRYVEVSGQIREIFSRHTDLIEPLSLDEAYLDVTQNKLGIPYAAQVAKEIRAAIRSELNLTASAGIAPVKFLAKIASDIKKPDGLTVITPEQVDDFVVGLAVKKIPGIGAVTQKNMKKRGITVAGDLRRFSKIELQKMFGKSGIRYYDLCRGIDDRPVRTSRKRKSFGSERTYAENQSDIDWIRDELLRQCDNLLDKMSTRDLVPRTVTIKVRYPDFTTLTRAHSLGAHTLEPQKWHPVIGQLLEKTEAGAQPVRLLGVSFSGWEAENEDRGQQELGL